jgi:hypothetical protein
LLCPFCAEEIKEQAVVCRHCHRDLAVQKPLLDENQALRKEIEDLRRQFNSLQRTAILHRGSPRPTAQDKSAFAFSPRYVAVYLLLPILLLLAAHYLIVIRFDLRELVLRLVSIALSLPFGFALYWRRRASPTLLIVTATIVGIAAVGGMLAAMSLIDVNVPIIPRDRREWQEAVEQALSIGLAMSAGYMFARVAENLLFGTEGAPGPLNALARSIISLVAPSNNERDLKARIESFRQVLGTLAVMATALGSIYAGVKSVLN